MKKFLNNISLISILASLCFGCSEPVILNLDSRSIAFLNADSSGFQRGGTAEWLVVDKCLKGQITLEILQNFLANGGKVNAFVYHYHTETHEYQSSNIPILEAFEPTGEYTIKPSFKINVFQAMMMRMPDHKMELCTYLLKNGADPNLRSPDGLVAAEYLLREQEKCNHWLTLEGDPFWDGKLLDVEAYSFRYIDTLTAYGARAENVNLKYAAGCHELLIRYLRLGADPKTIDVTAFITNLWAGSVHFAELRTYDIDFSRLKGEEFVEDLFSAHSLNILLNSFGFDPNTKVSDGYLLHWGIVEDRMDVVKLLVEKGGTKINEDKNPYLFATEQEASQEMLDYLAEKFGTK